MTTSAIIIADSIAAHGGRITTMQLRYPRYIHAEFMTHRVFSRNASSSRAIPVSRLIADVLEDPVNPIWGKNQRGMQDAGPLDAETAEECQHMWDCARRDALWTANRLAVAGAHKQVVNRLLEPFSHINVVVTSTEWANFFALRAHADAQPEIQALAREMQFALLGSTPRALAKGQWHLPYLTAEDEGLRMQDAKKVSAARCARVSYMTHEGKRPSVAEDLALFERLAGAMPMHLSPLEHQATPSFAGARSGNLVGWKQFRKEWEALDGGPATVVRMAA